VRNKQVIFGKKWYEALILYINIITQTIRCHFQFVILLWATGPTVKRGDIGGFK